MSFTPTRRLWQPCNEWPQRLSLHVIMRLCGGGGFFCSSAPPPPPPPPPQEVGGGWRRAHNEKLDDAGRWMDWGEADGGCRILNEEKKKWMRRRWREAAWADLVERRCCINQLPFFSFPRSSLPYYQSFLSGSALFISVITICAHPHIISCLSRPPFPSLFNYFYSPPFHV